jgi:hypothetical protein
MRVLCNMEDRIAVDCWLGDTLQHRSRIPEFVHQVHD